MSVIRWDKKAWLAYTQTRLDRSEARGDVGYRLDQDGERVYFLTRQGEAKLKAEEEKKA